MENCCRAMGNITGCDHVNLQKGLTQEKNNEKDES